MKITNLKAHFCLETDGKFVYFNDFAGTLPYFSEKYPIEHRCEFKENNDDEKTLLYKILINCIYLYCALIYGKTDKATDRYHYYKWALNHVFFSWIYDKNKQMIFSGDIIKIDNWNHPIAKVIFHNGAFCAEGLGGKFPFNGVELENATYEIIGNVWENPELLK